MSFGHILWFLSIVLELRPGDGSLLLIIEFNPLFRLHLLLNWVAPRNLY